VTASSKNLENVFVVLFYISVINAAMDLLCPNVQKLVEFKELLREWLPCEFGWSVELILFDLVVSWTVTVLVKEGQKYVDGGRVP
jgi:hypothetical protein